MVFHLVRRLKPIFCIICLLTLYEFAYAEIIVVPPGNGQHTQPDIPHGSAQRTREMATSYEEKYKKIYSLLENDAKLRQQIILTARQFDIDPIHIIGSIIGEHTFNVDIYDHLQTYYIKSITYLHQNISFSYKGEDIDVFINRPQFTPCLGLTNSYSLWTCRETVWNRIFRGKTVDGVHYPNNRFSAVFFQQFFAGQTFGLGQVNPLTALMVSDRVHEVTGLPKLSEKNGRAIYKTIMDPTLTLPYIAAIIQQSIDTYRNIAGFDISKNPGITTTLYNTGGPEQRAQKLAADNKRRRAQGLPVMMPKENYYGWFVNSKMADLERLVQ